MFRYDKPENLYRSSIDAHWCAQTVIEVVDIFHAPMHETMKQDGKKHS